MVLHHTQWLFHFSSAELIPDQCSFNPNFTNLLCKCWKLIWGRQNLVLFFLFTPAPELSFQQAYGKKWALLHHRHIPYLQRLVEGRCNHTLCAGLYMHLYNLTKQRQKPAVYRLFTDISATVYRLVLIQLHFSSLIIDFTFFPLHTFLHKQNVIQVKGYFVSTNLELICFIWKPIFSKEKKCDFRSQVTKKDLSPSETLLYRSELCTVTVCSKNQSEHSAQAHLCKRVSLQESDMLILPLLVVWRTPSPSGKSLFWVAFCHIALVCRQDGKGYWKQEDGNNLEWEWVREGYVPGKPKPSPGASTPCARLHCSHQGEQAGVGGGGKGESGVVTLAYFPSY